MKRLLWIFFLLLALLAVVAIVFSLQRWAGLEPRDAPPIFAGLLAFAIVWWQGHLINKQMELQAIIELVKEWNSTEMVKRRVAAWTQTNEPDDNKIEHVLEFLEKVSTLERRGIVSADLIWDTFGWYVWRYYYYCESIIDKARDAWTNKTDSTLYCDLEDLANRLLESEVENRNKRKRTGAAAIDANVVKAEMNRTKDKFINSEKTL